MLFLHGILGRGSNWRSIARRFVEVRPDWAAVLVDLRLHGDSLDFEPPHCVVRAAADLHLLRDRVPAIAGVLGHSFGGKVALAFGAELSLDEVWAVDSNPGPRPDRQGSEAIGEVLAALRAVPSRVSRRDDFVAALVLRGVTEPIARWLAMSLVRDDEGFRYPTDLDAIEELLTDYFAFDAWPFVDERTRIVIATRSAVFDEASRQRADASRARVHRIPSGHWVHVDAPEMLVSLLS